VDEATGLSLPLLVVLALAFMALVMSLAWVVQKLAHNTGWVDAIWTFGMGVTGAAVAVIPVEGDEAVMPLRRWIVAAMIALWALRLGTYIALRTVGRPEDARYRTLRKKWGGGYQGRLFLFLQMQGPGAVMLAIAPYLAARAPRFDIGVQDVLGLLIWIVAVAGETIADDQMNRFRADPRNRGKICNTGLWRWSRHPNYFFEWLSWCAYPVIAISVDDPVTLLSLIAPALMYGVLNYFTGVPMLERELASRGKAFEDYKARTSTFLLLPPRRRVPDKKTAAAKPAARAGKR
jgi:steroid 5-alpha reductase family enzyme